MPTYEGVMTDSYLRYYIASGFANRMMLRYMQKYLDGMNNYKCESSWIYKQFKSFDEESLRSCSMIDYGDIDKCDIVVAVYPFSSTGGAISEMGYALGRRIRIAYLVEQLFFSGIDGGILKSLPLPAGLLQDTNPNEISTEFDVSSKGYILYNQESLENYMSCIYKEKINHGGLFQC